MSAQETCDIDEFHPSIGNITGLTDILDANLFNTNEFSGLVENLNGTLTKIMYLEVLTDNPQTKDTFEYNITSPDTQKIDSKSMYLNTCNIIPNYIRILSAESHF